jgi:hypothetical protein
MTDRFASILDESISALQAGVSLDDILAEAPEYADELRPLLYAAAVLTDPNPALVPEETKLALRREYIKQVAELPALPLPTLGEKAQAVFNIIRKRLTRQAVLNDLMTIAITVVLTLLMAALILNYLSFEAIPGDFLYGFKRLGENAQLSLALTETQRLNLETGFNQRRLQEVEQLIDQNRAAVVQFRGVVETKGVNLWVVQGHTIFLPADIKVEDNVREGDTVEVIGLLRTNNVLVADKIQAVK